jgi:hypothetical protein
MFLSHLDFSGNYFSDEIAVVLAETLASNQILYKLDISRNCFGRKGAMAILKVLRGVNDTLECLRDISTCFEMGVDVIQEIQRCLRCNELSRHASAKTFRKDQIVVDGADQIKDSEAKQAVTTDYEDSGDYKLMKPIYESNDMFHCSQYLHWNV